MFLNGTARRAQICLAALMTALAIASGATAATVTVTGTATYGGLPGLVADMFGYGPVSFNLQFDIGPGTPSDAAISNASGTINWAAPDARVFEVNAGVVSGQAGQSIVMEFDGTGPGVPDIDLLSIELGFELGVDVLNTVAELSDLITGSTVNYFFALLQEPTGTLRGSSFGPANGGDVTGTVEPADVPISPVPLPAGLPMLILGLGILTALRQQSAASRTHPQSLKIC